MFVEPDGNFFRDGDAVLVEGGVHMIDEVVLHGCHIFFKFGKDGAVCRAERLKGFPDVGGNRRKGNGCAVREAFLFGIEYAGCEGCTRYTRCV
jgi:hypothetical protein